MSKWYRITTLREVTNTYTVQASSRVAARVNQSEWSLLDYADGDEIVIAVEGPFETDPGQWGPKS